MKNQTLMLQVNQRNPKFYSLQRSSAIDHEKHRGILDYLLNIVSTEKKNMDSDEPGEAKAVHWRKLLHACWFLTVFVDRDDLDSPDEFGD